MRKEKPLLLDEIKQKIDGAKAIIVTRYNKLEPNTSWGLRHLLGQSGSQFEVVKKRLLMKAAEQANIKLDAALLEGHIGVVFIAGEDAMPTAKAVFKFSGENENLLQVLCATVEGKIMPGAELEVLSKLPGIDEMRATLLALFTSPMSQMLSVLEASLAGPLSVIEKKSES